MTSKTRRVYLVPDSWSNDQCVALLGSEDGAVIHVRPGETVTALGIPKRFAVVVSAMGDEVCYAVLLVDPANPVHLDDGCTLTDDQVLGRFKTVERAKEIAVQHNLGFALVTPPATKERE